MSIWSVVGDAIGGVSSLIGAKMGSDANTEAAQIAAQGGADQAAAIREGNALAQARYDDLRTVAQPGINHLRTVTLTDPYEMTPGQKGELDDIRRQTTRTLNNSGLRGAGRTITAAIKNVETDARNKMIDTNVNRQDTSAAGLTGQYGNAVTGGANADIASGEASGRAADSGADARAGAATANAGLWGSAIGDVTGIISNELSRKDRESRYSDYLDTLTRRGSEAPSLGE